jgi:hypothetical protein
MKKPNFLKPLSLLLLCIILGHFNSSAQNVHCNATTLDDFYTCYGGREAFSKHSVDAVTAFIKAEEAVEAGDYNLAKLLVEDLFKTYPRGNNIWWNLYSDQNGANIGTPHAYYGLRMMEDIIEHGLNGNAGIQAKKANMKIVLVGESKGIQPTTKTELKNGTGPLVTNKINKNLKDNDYRIIKQSFDLFSKYVTAITKGKLVVEVEFIEPDALSLPVNVSTTLPYVASGSMEPVWTALDDKVKEKTDWWLILYPSHVPEFSTFDDESFITGGMGSDSKGGPVFIADDKWIVRKPAHLGKGDYSDIERRVYLPQWFQHEFFHHLYRIYPELALEVNGHDWFDRNFWPNDFVGQFENDYYSQSLHKRLQVDCAKLENKLITRVNDNIGAAFSSFSMDELLGLYSLEDVQNDWHEGNIIKEGNKYFWKNKANVKWEVFPNFANGRLDTGSDCPYPGKDFYIELFRTDEGNIVPGSIGIKFQGDIYKKRFELLRGSVPIEIANGLFQRVPNENAQHTGNLVKKEGKFYWENNAGSSWLLTPDYTNESFALNGDSPTPQEKFELIFSESKCGIYVLGFKYLNHYHWKPKRDLSNDAPVSINEIADVRLKENFGSFEIDIANVFKDPKNDSLQLFVTSENSALISPSIANDKLTLFGNEVGSTSIYLMAIDANGGLAIDEFKVEVEKIVGTDDNLINQNIFIYPSFTRDFIHINGATANCNILLTSIDQSAKKQIQFVGSEMDIDLSSFANGIYLLQIMDTPNGIVKVVKVVKY